MIKLLERLEELEKQQKSVKKGNSKTKKVKRGNKKAPLWKKILFYLGSIFLVLFLISLILTFIEGKPHQRQKRIKPKVTQYDKYMEKSATKEVKENKKFNFNTNVNSNVNDFNEGINAKKLLALEKSKSKIAIKTEVAKTKKKQVKILFKTEYFCKNLTPIDNEIIYFVKLNHKFIPVYSLENWDGRGIKFKKFEIKKALKKVNFKNHEFYEIEKGKYILNDKKSIKCFSQKVKVDEKN